MTFEQFLEKQIQGVDLEEIVRQEIRNMISADTRAAIRDIVNKKIETMIVDEFETVISGKVETDDGFGDRQEFESFEELFKKTFRERLNKTYEVKRLLDNLMKDRIDRFLNDNRKDVVKKFVDEVTEMLNKVEK